MSVIIQQSQFQQQSPDNLEQEIRELYKDQPEEKIQECLNALKKLNESEKYFTEDRTSQLPELQVNPSVFKNNITLSANKQYDPDLFLTKVKPDLKALGLREVLPEPKTDSAELDGTYQLVWNDKTLTAMNDFIGIVTVGAKKFEETHESTTIEIRNTRTKETVVSFAKIKH